MSVRSLAAYLLVLAMLTTAFAMMPAGSRAEQSSADAYGYYWTDSGLPSPTVTFSWVDISSTGTSLGFVADDDDYAAYVPIGFSFFFYGNTYTDLTVSTNGYLQFAAATSVSSNTGIPDTSNPSNIIAPFWDNLMVNYTPYNSGQIYYETIGTTPNQQFVVEFYEVSRAYYVEAVTFEVVLAETGEIWFQYLDMGAATGGSATVGIESSGGTYGCQYSYDTASIIDGLAIMFDRGPVGFGPDLSSFASWGTSAVYNLVVTNGGSVDDSFDITVDSTDLGWDVALYTTSWTDLPDTNGNTIPDTGTIAPGASYAFRVYVTVPALPTGTTETTVLLATSYGTPANYDTATLTTTTYDVMFMPYHSSAGYDDDADGDYDYLVVNACVGAVADTDVRIYSELTSSGTHVTDVDVYEYVYVGMTNVTLAFSGEDIFSSLLDGPYDADMYLYDSSDSYVGGAAHTTALYTYDEFDPPPALLTTPFSDWATDQDWDGMYDYLVIEVSFTAYETGDYSLEADLYDPYGSFIGYVQNFTTSVTGLYVVQFWFPSYLVNLTGAVGAFYAYIYLFDMSTTLDYALYYTSTYDYGEFMGPGVLFAPPYDDYVTDDDTDGYYDSLVFVIPVACYDDGTYDLRVEVYDYYYDILMYYNAWGQSLTAGTTTDYYVTVDGTDIWLNGVSGYVYLEMYLYANSTTTEIDTGSYSTGTYYYYYWFEQMGAYIDYMYDYGDDTDSDGYYNVVTVEMYIEPYGTGDYELYIVVDDYWGDTFLTIDEMVYLVEDVEYVYTFTLDGYDIVANGLYGYFYVVAYIYDETGTYMWDSFSDYTSYYSTWSFDPIGAYFVTPYYEYTVDEDSDGLYDMLVETVYFTASSTGYYDFEYYIYDPWGYSADWDYVTLYLEEGVTSSYDLVVTSEMVWEYANDGSWEFYVYLYDHYTYIDYDSDVFYSDNYYYTDDFDPPGLVFDAPHYDYGYDGDSDGYYDFLIVQAELYCYEPGEYTVFADLYDPYWNYIATASATDTFSVGSGQVDFSFEGWLIYYQGVSGYYIADMWAEDSSGYATDYDTHYTDDYYYWYYFESPPAELSPPHADYALDADLDGMYDYLVVNVSVEVYTPGEYIVAGILYDDYGYEVDAAYTMAALDDGLQTVQLYFYAWSISVAYSDPWYVELYLMDYYENLMDEGTYYLGTTYPRGDFDATIPTIESGWAYVPPTVSGNVTEDEWFGADAVDFLVADPVNRVEAYMYVLNNGTHLFVLIDAVGDTTATEGDSAAIAFDTSNDEAATDGAEDQFVLEATDVGTDTSHWVYEYGYWELDCYPFDPDLADHAGIAGAAGFGTSALSTTPHRIYEFCIPLELLGSAMGDTIGFAGLSDNSPAVYDADEDIWSTWPAYYWTAAPELDHYGDLVLSEEPPLTSVDLAGDEGLLGWFWSDVEVELTATGGTGGINATYYNLDDDGWTVYGDPFTVSGDGTHILQYYSTDLSSNYEPVRTIEVMIDTEVPTAEAVANGTLGDNAWFVSAATVTFEADDDTSGFSHIMYSLDGDDWEALDGMTMTVGTDGAHTLEYYAVDISGLEGEAHTIGFMVDMNVPATVAYDIGYAVTLTATDSGSGVSVTMYRIDGGEWITYDGTFEVTGEGNHTVEYYSVDAAGNEEAIQTIVVEGKAGIGIWVWALAGGLAAAVAVGLLLFMLLRRRRGGQQPQQYVPAQGYAVPPTMEPPPPPSQ